MRRTWSYTLATMALLAAGCAQSNEAESMQAARAPAGVSTRADGPGEAARVSDAAPQNMAAQQYQVKSITISEDSTARLKSAAGSPAALDAAKEQLQMRQEGPGATTTLVAGDEALFVKTMTLDELVRLAASPLGEQQLLQRKADVGAVALREATAAGPGARIAGAQLMTTQDGRDFKHATAQSANSDIARALRQKVALTSGTTAMGSVEVPFMLRVVSEQTPFLAVRKGEQLHFIPVGRDPWFAKEGVEKTWTLNDLAQRISAIAKRSPAAGGAKQPASLATSEMRPPSGPIAATPGAGGRPADTAAIAARPSRPGPAEAAISAAPPAAEADAAAPAGPR